MNYPKEFYVTQPTVGDKVWLNIERFESGHKAFHGPWWIKGIHIVGEQVGVKLHREAGKDAVVLLSELLRMSKTQIKKMAVLKNPV